MWKLPNHVLKMILKCLCSCASVRTMKKTDFGPRLDPLKLLGRGVEGDVWACQDRELKTIVAAKHVKLSAKNRRMVARELEAALCLPCHAHLVMPVDVIRQAHMIVLIMELVQGSSVAELQAGKALPWAFAQSVALQLARALAHCHAHGMAFMDVKTANVLVAGDPPLVRLCDFGLARQVGMENRASGTPGYLAPEALVHLLASNQPPYDSRAADVWSFGALVHCMLIGEPPYGFLNACKKARTKWEAMKQVLDRSQSQSWYTSLPLEQLQSVPYAAQDLLDRLLQPDPVQRPAIDEVLGHPWLKDGLLPAVGPSVMAPNTGNMRRELEVLLEEDQST